LNQSLKNKLTNWLLILIITIIWGLAWVYMKLILQYMAPFTFTAVRFGIGAIVLLIVVSILKQGIPKKEHWLPLAIIGLFQTAIAFCLVMYALQFIEAGKSSILLFSMPIWSSILAVKFLGEKISPLKLLGLFIGFIGLLTIIGWDVWTKQSPEIIIGEILITLAAISWSISNIYYRLKLKNIPPIQMTAFQMLFGAIAIVVVAMIKEWSEPITINGESIFYILFTAVLASALAYTLWFIVLTKIDVATATISTMLVPVFGLTFSSLIIGEKMTFSIIVGSLLIISGIIIAQLTNQRKISK